MLLLDFLTDTKNDLEQLGNIIRILMFLGIGIPIVIWIISRIKTDNLSSNFKSLGNMTGMTKDEIVQKVGLPQSAINMGSFMVCSWTSPGYMITIKFSPDGVFQGIHSERAL